MKTLRVLMSTAIFTIAFCVTVMAGTWKSDANGWWFDEGNGSFPKNTWSWIDGNNDGVSECYYFDQNGYCLINTITPDNYYVNMSGAWTIDGMTQTRGTGTVAVSHSNGTSVDVVTSKLSIGEKKDNKSNSKSSSSKKNHDDDDYDDENDDVEEDDDDDDDENDNRKESSEKKSSKKSNNLFDMNLESSRQLQSVPSGKTLRGEKWDDGIRLFTSAFDICHVCNAEYYIGGKYKKLTIKATPETSDNKFHETAKVKVTIYNAETDEVLDEKTFTHSTKVVNFNVDVTDVNYILIESEFIADTTWGMGNILMKDAILTK